MLDASLKHPELVAQLVPSPLSLSLMLTFQSSFPEKLWVNC